LAVPPAEGFNRLAWVMPFAVIVFGLFAIWLYIRRFRKPAPVPVMQGPDPLGRFRDEIEKDLAKLD
jgi:cytochrome c-type biogenesis protein CcmH/NrfF